MADINDKSSLRSLMRTNLAAMTPQQRHGQSLAACQRLMGLEVFRHANVVMLFMPLANEVDLTPIALRCFQSGKTVCVPQVDWRRREMQPVEVTSFDDDCMDTDVHGLRTPRDCRPVVPTTIDLVLVPGLAFDTSGRRLGRGGGFYDRFLTRLRRSATTVGLAFDSQIVDLVPIDQADVVLDVLVTDRRVSHSGPSRSRR